MAVAPAVPIGNTWLVVVAVGLAIGTGTYWAWVHSDRSAAIKSAGFAGAGTAALAGGWLGFQSTAGLLAVVTTIVGAALGANLVLILLDIAGARSSRRSAATPDVDAARELVGT